MIEGRLRGWIDARWHRVPDSARRLVELARTRPGHFYSPYPSWSDVADRSDAIFAAQKSFAGIDLRVDEQLRTLAAFDGIAAEFPWSDEPVPGCRYHYNNRPYAYGDGLFTAAMLVSVEPQRYVEVGSGFSTLLALDVRDRWLPKLDITTIDPYPQRLYELLDGESVSGQSTRIVAESVQSVDPAVFGALESGDVLFIDSTHVAKAGSDVNHLIFEVLPTLASGVYVHIHDVFGNFEYPKEWVMQGRAWTEAYVLRAFLQHNDAFEVSFWGHWLAEHHRDRFGENLAPALVNPGASLWIRRR